MSEKNINQEAFKQAEKELLEKKVEEVKDLILTTLELIESKKKEKVKVEEELRVLKLDIEDLRKGNFDKIKERQSKSPIAKSVSVSIPSEFTTFSLGTINSCTNVNSSVFASDGTCSTGMVTATSGTYPLSNGKTVYLSESVIGGWGH